LKNLKTKFCNFFINNEKEDDEEKKSRNVNLYYEKAYIIETLKQQIFLKYLNTCFMLFGQNMCRLMALRVHHQH
jgi:hypothetical protein